MIKNNTKTGFSLVEILIVVCVLGILAAIVVPHYTNATTKANEAAAKTMLQTLREQIEIYTLKHNNVPPGYINGFGSEPLGVNMLMQFKHYTNIQSEWNSTKSAEYCYGPYIKKFSVNPFNDKWNVYVIETDPGSGDWPGASDTYGWLYYPPAKAIRLNTFGTDSAGKSFQSY